MKAIFFKLTVFLKSKPLGLGYSWGKIMLWLFIALVFLGFCSWIGMNLRPKNHSVEL